MNRTKNFVWNSFLLIGLVALTGCTSDNVLSTVVERQINANVKKLVLNHLAPAPDNRILKNLYMKELKAFEGPIHLANDGDVFIVDGESKF